jgi:hypothetical protein
MGAKEDESSTGEIGTTGVHRVTTRSRLADVLKITNRTFNFRIFLRPWYTMDVNMGARLYSTGRTDVQIELHLNQMKIYQCWCDLNLTSAFILPTTYTFHHQ